MALLYEPMFAGLGFGVPGTIHLVKLCVGIESVDELIAAQARRFGQEGNATPRHVTRMRPKRHAELVDGGSLYWVIKGQILARQRIVGLEGLEDDEGVARCAILLGRDIIRTVAAPRRPFQGWRYLEKDDAPSDLRAQASRREDADALPPELDAALSEIGVL